MTQKKEEMRIEKMSIEEFGAAVRRRKVKLSLKCESEHAMPMPGEGAVWRAKLIHVSGRRIAYRAGSVLGAIAGALRAFDAFENDENGGSDG